ncbi:MAG: hypothetical protein J7L19_03080 [Dehalococcoidia bacterium]|nr:hypothetical protein [Dehalococcoidia bacterium]
MGKIRKSATPDSRLASSDEEKYEQGLRALARLIARAHLSNVARRRENAPSPRRRLET